MQKPDNTFPNNKVANDTLINKTATSNDTPIDALVRAGCAAGRRSTRAAGAGIARIHHANGRDADGFPRTCALEREPGRLRQRRPSAASGQRRRAVCRQLDDSPVAASGAGFQRAAAGAAARRWRLDAGRLQRADARAGDPVQAPAGAALRGRQRPGRRPRARRGAGQLYPLCAARARRAAGQPD